MENRNILNKVNIIDWHSHEISDSIRECIVTLISCTPDQQDRCCYRLESHILPHSSLCNDTEKVIPILRDLSEKDIGLPCIYELFIYILCAVEESKLAPISINCKTAIKKGFLNYLKNSIHSTNQMTRLYSVYLVGAFQEERTIWECIFNEAVQTESEPIVKNAMKEVLEQLYSVGEDT